MRRPIMFISMAVVVFGLLVKLSGVPAWAARNFTFHGSGNGHGIGMSQWGSYGLAQAGWSYRRILTHYYRGTSVESPASVPRRVRVGITRDRELVHVGARSGPVRLWLSAPWTGTRIARIPNGDTWTVKAAPTGYVIRDQDGARVGRRSWGGPSTDLFATYEDTGSRVFIQEADPYGAGHAYNRGHIEFNLYDCAGGCKQRLIVPLRFEEYLYGLAEVPARWPAAALRAQAVAARSYAAHAIDRAGSRAYCNCDVTDDVSDQVYTGYDREGSPDAERWVDAVRDTRGRVVVYAGDIIQAFYSSSNGGHSESVQNVWHGGNPAYAIPWLRGVCDPGEANGANPWTDWSRSFAAVEATGRLRPYTGDIGRVRRFTGIERGPSGRIIRLAVRGAGGMATISGSSLRSAFGLPDTRAWVNSNHNILGQIRRVYDAARCRPGLPGERIVVRRGVHQRFHRGSISTYEPTGLTVWLKGPIDHEYRALGGATGRLGLPTSEMSSRGCSRCGRVVFDRGRIYWKRGLGAFGLWGGVLDTYLDRHGANGPLGFPTSRPSRDPSGAWSATFQHGSITCLAGTCSVTT